MPEFEALRECMIERQIASRGIRDPRILNAFRAVPRERFVPPDLATQAYDDNPLPIAEQQTISQPFVVALMIDAAAIAGGDRVLEVGAGSGYAAAVIGRIAAHVIAIERHPLLATSASARMRELDYENVEIVQGDGTLGWPTRAPYDAILVSASGRHAPTALIDQLALGGRLVMPLGRPGAIQQLVRLTKLQDGSIEQADLGPVRFVPLIGEEGWSDG